MARRYDRLAAFLKTFPLRVELAIWPLQRTSYYRYQWHRRTEPFCSTVPDRQAAWFYRPLLAVSSAYRHNAIWHKGGIATLMNLILMIPCTWIRYYVSLFSWQSCLFTVKDKTSNGFIYYGIVKTHPQKSPFLMDESASAWCGCRKYFFCIRGRKQGRIYGLKNRVPD